MKQTVLYARFHESQFWPAAGNGQGVGDFTQFPLANKTVAGITVSEGPNGLVFEAPGRSTLVVPYATVKTYVLGPVEYDTVDTKAIKVKPNVSAA